MMDANEWMIMERFHPFYAREFNRVRDDNVRFVHYTSAAAAMSIASSRSFWMRNARVMNDFSEIDYGLSRLSHVYHGPIGDRFKKCVDAVVPGLSDEIATLIDGWIPHYMSGTYLMSISEHAGQHAEHEDQHGRLSMWRAYGSRTSVALVLKNAPFLAPSEVLKAYASPVLYADQSRFDMEFNCLTAGIEESGAVLKLMGREALKNRVFNTLHFAILCTKHPGFQEEREWRVIHSAQMHPSKHLLKEIEVIDGTPQFVYKIPLKNIPDEEDEAGFFGAEIPDLLDRVIIGPSEDGLVVQEAIIDVLTRNGVADAAQKVFVSGIPLRN